MPSRVTRRDFLATAASVGAISGVMADEPGRATTEGESLSLRRASFDDGWRFKRGDTPDAQRPDFSDSDWSSVDLPHDWSIAGPYGQDEPSGGSGGYLPTGVGWYRKRFILPPSLAAKRVRVEFDGVYQRSEVWINGQYLGMRPYGYISFGYDLTPYLRFGGAPNILAVRVDNSLQPNSRWYSGSGIYRHTWLVTTDPVHIAPWGVCVRTPVASGESALLEVTTRVVNASGRDVACMLQTAIADHNGMVVGTASAQREVQPAADHLFVQHIKLDRPDLWTVDAPVLYAVQTALRTADGHSDQTTTKFGVRRVDFDADRGFVLNGERVKLNGVCLHGDCGAVGTAVPIRMWERRLAILKEMGCNAVRCSHNPPAPEFLDLCDTMGLLVMAEAFDEWRQPKLQTPQFGYHKYFDEWATRDLKDMIARDRNHPSIVIWSAGNEVPDQTDEQGPQTLKTLRDILHKDDPTRMVTVACDNIAAEPKATLPEFLAELDVVGYNYVDRWRDRREKYYSIDRHDFPRRRFVGTESTALGGVRGAYQPDNAPPVFGERPSNRRIAVEQLQKFIQTYDYVSGDFLWTGIDYLGESRWPNKLASSGVLDTCGFAKDGYYFYQSLWTKKPVLHLSPHWNWTGREGEIISVTCYTNCDTVELFLNGKSLGTKGFAFPRPGMIEKYGTYPDRAKALQTTADLHLAWDVAYAPGTLRAEGTTGGRIVSTSEVSTTGEPDAIRLTADRTAIRTDRDDVAHIKVEIVDRNGLLVPTAAEDIAFSLTGNGRIIGVDNGQPDSHESYQASSRRTFNGLALVLLQASGEPTTMALSASATSLKGAEIRIVAA